jgi:hypothetical protein
MRRRYLDTIIVEIIHRISDGHDSENYTIAGFDFFDVRCGFLTHDTGEIEDYRWHIWIHECEWTMLQLTCRVALGMDIGELLELQ